MIFYEVILKLAPFIIISILQKCFNCNSLYFQNSLFGSIDDHQYRQLYHPAEDYNSFRDSSPSPNRPSVNAAITKSSSSNLDPIREEGAANPDRSRTVVRGNTQTRTGTEAINSSARPHVEDERETPPSQRGKFYI